MLQNAAYLRAKNEPKYSCIKCDYSTSKICNWKRHVESNKHKMLHNAAYLGAKTSQKNIWRCACGRKYKQHQSFYRHKKHCTMECGIGENEEALKTKVSELEEELAKVQEGRIADLQAQNIKLEELVKTAQSSVVNNNFNNCMIILNTHCASAISMAEFTKNLRLTSEDLVYTKQNGYIEGVSHVFIKGLQDLDPTQRPIQCSDKKGKNIYVKEEGTWEKDEGEVLGSHISLVSKKQVDALKVWEEQHPNWKVSEEQTETYMELVREIMGGSSNEERLRNHKLIQQKIGQNCRLSDVVGD